MSSYTHFTLDERKRLQELLAQGCSIRMMARSFGRSPSSVSREISRNSSSKGYNHWRAQSLAIDRSRNKRNPSLTSVSPEWGYIVDKLNCFWSPEQIANRWRLGNPEATLSTMTIYRYIKQGLFPNISRKTHLRRRGKMCHSRKTSFNAVHPDRTIPQWTDDIKNRARLGDWEGDTVYGAVGKGLLVTLVDRKSRYLSAGLLESRTTQNTNRVVINLLRSLPVNSISLDNGTEFSDFREIEDKLKTLVYFAEPHKPWQRGSNENANDLLRFFFPKGTDFHSVSPNHLNAVVNLINHRPRKTLHWLSPHEVFFGVALA